MADRLTIDTGNYRYYRFSPGNYCHFVLGNLLELYVFLTAERLSLESTRLVLNNPSPRFLEGYEIFTRHGAEIGSTGKPDLVVPGLLDWRKGNESEALRHLNGFAEHVRHHFGTTATVRDTLTYILRPFNLKTRFLANENAVIAALRHEAAGLGLNLVAADFGAMGFAEQVRLMGRTRLLVGLHGAGIVNSLFCAPGSAVIEIYPHPAFSHRKFELICTTRGITYHRLRQVKLSLPNASNALKALVYPGHMQSNRYLRDRCVVADIGVLTAEVRRHAEGGRSAPG